eukprot:COSAG01_NODE_3286_length_6306_cov_30.604445_5_plen_317_part_00
MYRWWLNGVVGDHGGQLLRTMDASGAGRAGGSFPPKTWLGGGGDGLADQRVAEFNAYFAQMLGLGQRWGSRFLRSAILTTAAFFLTGKLYRCDLCSFYEIEVGSAGSSRLERTLLAALWGRDYDRLARHHTALREAGYDDLELLAEAEVPDLQEVGVSLPHATEILRRASTAVTGDGGDENRGAETLRELLRAPMPPGSTDDDDDDDDDDVGDSVSETDTSDETESGSEGGSELSETTAEARSSAVSASAAAAPESSDSDVESNAGAGGGQWMRPGQMSGPSANARKTTAKATSTRQSDFQRKIARMHSGRGNQAW